MPFSKIQVALVEDVVVRELLVQDAAHAVGAALGGQGEPVHAGVGELEHELRREVVEAQRGDRDLVVQPGQVVHDAVDLRMVADGGGDEADLVRVTAGTSRARVHDLLRARSRARAGSCTRPSRTGTCRGSRARSPP